MKSNLKTICAGVLAVMLALPTAISSAADVSLTLGHVAPPQTTYQDAAVRFADKLSELSDGTMSVNIVPGGALGGLGELWAQTRTNALDLHLIDIGALIAMKEASPFLVLFAPYLFRDQDHFHSYVQSDVFKGMMKDVEEKTGVVYLGYVGDRPPRVVTSRTPVTTPDDLKGLKIRTPQHPFIINTFKTWGAASTPLGAAELLISLKTGVVDGQDNGVIDFVGAGYADANKYFAPIDYIHSGIGLWMSPEKWASMTEQQRAWLMEAAEYAGVAGRDIHVEQMKSAFEALQEEGVTVTEPDLEAFRSSIEPMVTGMDGKAWPEGLYATISGL
ncbi:MAG: TRAP transporter substrate-binding protein [Alphaproteobacteria bacterium]|nr:TRAP transporter substrate-binding protein [Alphaproteobacteria bacterium]